MTIKDLFIKNYHFEIDSRKIQKNDVFIALKGKNTDGHKYVEDAFKKGASFAVVNNEYPITSEKIIKADNVLDEMLKISSTIINNNARMKIGITGSTGKTTTKICLKNIFENNISTFATEKNFNTEIGIPLSILNNYNNEEVVILEMGIQNKGDMEYLTDFYDLDVAFITNIGTSHIEFFKTKSAIAREKSKIINSLAGGLLVYNYDSTELKEYVNSYNNKITFGQTMNQDSYLINYEYVENTTKVYFKLFGKDVLLTLNSFWNKGQILDLLAAISFSVFAKIPLDPYIISDIKLPESRFEFIKNKKNIIINDSYNASEESFLSAFESIEKINSKKKTLIMGEIKEIGNNNIKIVEKILEKAESIFDDIFFYDPEKSYSLKNINMLYNFEDLEKILESNEGIILIKGSNSTGLYDYMKERGK
ncbi:MAG: UDP-N-acetylmuramoyl-tripeptide--D-alanyl-D-alanine ligase [Thermotogota bacterium]